MLLYPIIITGTSSALQNHTVQERNLTKIPVQALTTTITMEGTVRTNACLKILQLSVQTSQATSLKYQTRKSASRGMTT